MPRTKISEFSATAADNTDINGINLAEGMLPSDVNNSIRELMAQIKDLQAGTSGDTIPITAGGTGATTASAARTALGATTTGNSLFTSVDAAAARTTLGATTTGDALFISADAAAGRAALGATTTGNSLFTAVDAAAGRTAISAASSGANSDITSLTGLTTALSVAQGGTGAATLTANNVLLGNGTSALQAVAPGTSGNVLTSNGTSWTSAEPPPSAGSLAAIASGALANGDKVIVNPDGTVSVVESSTFTVFEAAEADFISAIYDPTSNKVIIAYEDVGNSRFGTAIVGAVSGGNISFGTPVVFESASTDNISVVYDSANDKVVIAYRDDAASDVGTAIVGTVSGTSISFGTPVVFDAIALPNAAFMSTVYDSTNEKVVIAYLEGEPHAIVGTVSGTSISFGTRVRIENVAATFISATYDSANSKVVVAYQNTADADGSVKVGTVSGTSISFGSVALFFNGATTDVSASYDSANGKVVIAYARSLIAEAKVGTVSGTTISFGTATQFSSTDTDTISSAYNSAIGKIVIAYRDDGAAGDPGKFVLGTVSGTAISFNTPEVFNATNSFDINAVYDSDSERIVIAYQDVSNSNFGTATVLTSNTNTNTLTSGNYIGISNGVYADGATATIQTIGSVDDAQSGLTAGQSYFVQSNNTLSTTPGTPSVFAGTAVSATKLIVKG